MNAQCTLTCTDRGRKVGLSSPLENLAEVASHWLLSPELLAPEQQAETDISKVLLTLPSLLLGKTLFQRIPP